MQLERDAQVEVAVERFVMGHERTRVTAPRHFLEDRGLDFEKATRLEQAAQCGDDPGPRPEDVADFGVRDEVDIALPVADLDVFEPVPLLGQRSKRLGEQLE